MTALGRRRLRSSLLPVNRRAAAEAFMRVALQQAARGLGRTAPNPAVGAVIVKAGRIVGRGHHQRAGGPHAEVLAIRAAGAQARGADLYTTLEPCNHHGRTPPCTDAILKAGLRRVVFASSDPNPLVNGRGVTRLRRAGVEVYGGVLREEADRLNRPFLKFMRSGRPWVTLKAAISLDGKLATASGDSRWVSGEASRRRVHQLRDQVDAILVGAGTVKRDDPRLTTRLPSGGRDPVRVVVDSRLSVPLDRQVYRLASSARTIVATLRPGSFPRARQLVARGVEVWTLPGRNEQVDLGALLERLGEAGLLHLLVEGGSEIFGSFLAEDAADELMLFLAPRVVGAEGLSWVGNLGILSMAKAKRIKSLRAEPSGEDLLLFAEL